MTVLTRPRRTLQEVYQPYISGQRCAVPRCRRPAAHLGGWGDFREQDFTCPFICGAHRSANGVDGQRFANLHQARGWSEYWPLGAAKEQR